MEPKWWTVAMNSITLWSIKIVAVLEALPALINWIDINFDLHLAVNVVIIKVLTYAALAVAWIRHFILKKEVAKK